MNIIYIHGLDSKLSAEKRNCLEQYGTVLSPDLNYYDNPDSIQSLLDEFSSQDITVVIGSSMGGFAGYYLANALNVPALLFNPALKERSVMQNIPKGISSFNNLKQIVIGQIDDVIYPADTMNFLLKEFNPKTDLYLHLVPELGHNIPLQFFEKEVNFFLENLVHKTGNLQ